MNTASFNKERSKAILLLAATAVLWSLGGLLIKLVDAVPLAISGVRSTIAFIILLAVIRKPKLNWSVAQLGAALAYTATTMLFVTATKTTTAANAILLQFTAPVYVAILGTWFLKEKARLIDWVTIFIVIGGMGLFFLDSLSTKGFWGNICGAASGISFAFFTVFMRMQKDGSPMESVLLGNLFTAIIGLPFLSQSVPSPSGWIYLVILGVVQLGIPYVLYSIAIKNATALEAILVPVLEPILNPVWVLLAIGEVPSTLTLLGGAVVLMTVTLRCVYTIIPINMVLKNKIEK